MPREALEWRVGEQARNEVTGHLLMDSPARGTKHIPPLKIPEKCHGVRHGSWQDLGSLIRMQDSGSRPHHIPTSGFKESTIWYTVGQAESG